MVRNTDRRHADDDVPAGGDRIESEHSQGFGFNGTGTGVTTLKNVEEHDFATCAQIGEEMTRYFDAKQEYGDLLDRATKQPDQTAALIAAAKAKLEDARKETKAEIIREQLAIHPTWPRM